MPTSPCGLQDLLAHLPRCRRSAGASSVPPRPRLSKRCQSEEVEFMTSATVKRVFEVDAPLEEAWRRLAEVERWPEWAPHITSVTVSPPGLGVGRRAAWGPHLWAPGAAHSTCLRPSVRSQSRQGDPQTAGVVSPMMAGMQARRPVECDAGGPQTGHSRIRIGVRCSGLVGRTQAGGVGEDLDIQDLPASDRDPITPSSRPPVSATTPAVPSPARTARIGLV
jgi:Polyketide cyclase / dehydrase and lipid transport